MRTRILMTAALVVAGLGLSACHRGHPGHDSDYHRGHHRDHH